jgi:hypothetical protein
MGNSIQLLPMRLPEFRYGKLKIFSGEGRMNITTTTPRFRPDWPSIINHTITAVSAALLIGLFGLFGFLRPIHITADRADQFFLNYFGAAPSSSQRHSVYENDLTPTFRSFNPWGSYNNFWKPISYVEIDQAIPVLGNPLEFTVNATFHPVNGSPWHQSFDYYLTCSGFIGTLRARAVQCPLDHIQVDRLVWLNPGS